MLCPAQVRLNLDTLRGIPSPTRRMPRPAAVDGAYPVRRKTPSLRGWRQKERPDPIPFSFFTGVALLRRHPACRVDPSLALIAVNSSLKSGSLSHFSLSVV